MKKQFRQKPLSNLEIAEFCNQMSLMLQSGISSTEALHLLLEDSQTESEQELLKKLVEDIEQMGFLHEAATSTGVFPYYALHMIKLGEETGTLDDVLLGLSDHYTREENLLSMIRSAFIYPSIMLGMMVLVIIVLLTKVMPIFNEVFQQLGQEMTGFSAGLLHLGNLLSRYSIAFIALIIVMVAILFFCRKHLPFQRKIKEQLSACRFADGMSIALKSGMSPEQSLELALHLVDDNSFLEKLQKCKQEVSDGMDLAKALRQSNIFTGAYARMASIAEKTGMMDEAMAKISSEYEYSANKKITSLISMLEPTLVIILSLIAGIILFSVMIPLLGIMTSM